jgi:hypothetical protein
MTPSARVQMAIEILEALETTSQPTDRFLKAWFRNRRFAGSGDRRAIAERVFSVQRHHAALAHRMGDERQQSMAEGALQFAFQPSTAGRNARLHWPRAHRFARQHLEGIARGGA